MAKVLVVGGAGYVGSATCAWLLDRGHDIWVLDDLSTGHRDLVLSKGFTRARAGNQGTLKDLLSSVRFDCVMHFAARSLVGESVVKRDEYFENNVDQTRLLLESLIGAGVKKFIFSSSCAVFGDPGNRVITETLPKNPINPYGETKLAVERMLEHYAKTSGLQAIALRYFNAAGAEPSCRVGEWHKTETHLIPNILEAAVQDKPILVFGNDYPTPDGTCVRDYIHVTDLATAHEAAMFRLLDRNAQEGTFEAFNLGSQSGYSVSDIIQTTQRVLGKKLKIKIEGRRPGDPARLVANSSLAHSELGFRNTNDIDTIISSAWKWERKRLKLKKAIFLDRDGTLNEDPGYINNPEHMKLFSGVADALAKLQKAGFLLVVVSNQSGVARGLIEPDMVPRIHARMDELLAAAGAKIDHYELCFHHPDDDCECRKPKPKLILDAAKKLGIGLSLSYMIGDKEIDLSAGRSAGCKAVALTRTGYGKETEGKLRDQRADFTGDSLDSIADWILSRENAAP